MNDFNNTEIKAKGVFDDKNIAQKIGAGIAILMGAAGAALGGQKENYAIKVFDDAIKQDLEVQKANLAKKKDAVSMTGLIQDAARKAGMSKEQAEAKVFEYRYGQIQSELQGIADRTNDETLKANALQKIGDLEVKKNAMLAEANKITVETKDQTETRPLTKAERGNPPEGKEVPPTQQESALKNYAIGESLDDLEALRAARNGDAGPLKGRWEQMKARYKFASNEDVSHAIAKSEQLGQKILQKLSGTAASDKQAATIKEFTPLWTDNDPGFAGKLANLREEITTEREALERGYDMQPKNFNWPWRGKTTVQQDKDALGFK